MMAPAQWIETNMLGTYSEALGRPLTEPEMRVQRCLEQMPVPDWYQKYSRPPNILKNCVPFECRPASWKIYNKSSNTPRKLTKKRSFRKSPKKSESESSRTSTADSGYQDACRSSHRTPKKNEDSSLCTSPCSSSGSESDSPKIDEDVPPILNASGKSFRSPLNNSNSYPRMSRSRKIQNINIVFPQPFPAQNDRLQLDMPKTSSAPNTVYTMTKNFDLQQRDGGDSASQTTIAKKTHTSFLIADVKPSGVTTRVQMFAGPLTSDSGSSDEEQPRRCAPSPHSRFISSAKKSTALEKIVQTRRTESGSLIQKIIEELNRSSGSTSSVNGGSLTGGTERLTPEAQNFVKSMVDALEQSCYDSSEEEDQQSTVSSDSELAKSTSISFKSYDLDSVDDHPSSPLPPLSSAGEYCSSSEDDYRDEEEEEREYWIPCYKTFDMPRTSSQMSNCSNRSGRRSGHSSPGLSPIKREDWLQKHGDIWGMTFNAKETKSSSSRQLFRIDETGVGDSGYSDRSTSASSRTATLSSERSSRGSSSPAYCSSSASSTPTMRTSYESPSQLPLSRSGPYVMRSFFV